MGRPCGWGARNEKKRGKREPENQKNKRKKGAEKLLKNQKKKGLKSGQKFPRDGPAKLYIRRRVGECKALETRLRLQPRKWRPKNQFCFTRGKKRQKKCRERQEKRREKKTLTY